MTDPLSARRDIARGSLRRHAARGTMINGAFTVGLNSLGLLRGFIVASMLAASDYGIWGILMVAIGGLFWLKQIGINDKYVQQDDEDQELAFQRAFTIETLYTGGFMVLLIMAVPLVALAYGRSEILLPALVLCSAVPATVLQMPLWAFYRSMHFAKQRALGSIDPVVGFVVTVALAFAGLGYWALVIGTVAGSCAAAAGAVIASPYRLRWRYDGGTLREYASFSWPLLVTAGSRFIVAQSAIFVGSWTLGLAAVGYITLASSISNYATRVDEILATTLYPAICAVKDRTDLLYESFVKSNRLALMWGVPFGVGVALFAPQLVGFVLGPEWEGGIGLLQVFGLVAALNHVGYNWHNYFRARGDTRPVGTLGVLNLVTTLGVGVPLMLAFGLTGFAIGLAFSTVASLLCRGYFLARLFPTLAMVRHAARAMFPTVPGAVLILVIRATNGSPDMAVVAALELAVFCGTTALATWLLEWRLLREALSYLRRAQAQAPAQVPPPAASPA